MALIEQEGLHEPSGRKADLMTPRVMRYLGMPVANDYHKWSEREGGVSSYHISFERVLEEKTLPRLVGESLQRAGKAYVLDLMGYGSVLRDLPILPPHGGGLAVALGDPRSDKTHQRDEERNINLIAGNILRASTWSKMEAWLDSQSLEDKKFDLILSRPCAGFEALANNEGVAIVLLQRAWRLLSAQGGVLLTQLPKRLWLEERNLFDESVIEEWVQLLNQTPGIRANHSPAKHPENYSLYSFSALSLVKTPGAPDRLPLL